ncbi:hypothetical protein O185_11975 [Photorhabdus temperata J3]|uniref:Uncharacterized protein n=1 Tax=Photorhabdus temperata J3 TaxID=1389415 RepID=U7R0D7_PHOTE|nr:hypothetical protein O185_11975 [Photorhabdus temperata J3]
MTKNSLMKWIIKIFHENDISPTILKYELHIYIHSISSVFYNQPEFYKKIKYII